MRNATIRRDTSTSYARAKFRGVAVEVRPPQLRDAPAWSATRRAEQARLGAAFADDSGQEWAQMHSELAFAERWARLRTAALHGRALPAIVVVDQVPEPGRRPGRQAVVGEMGLDKIDQRTGTGELSVWMSVRAPSGRIARWATAAVILRAFTSTAPLRRVVAPFAVGNRGPRASLSTLGFHEEALLRQHRSYAGRLTDHHLYVLHNDVETRERLQSLIGAGCRGS